MQGYQLSYYVDMVLVIDATGSMRHVLDMVKKNALNLYQDIIREMKQKNKTVEQLRVRVIAFRDYMADEGEAMLSSEFFVLPEQSELLLECVNGIAASGGGDIPEDGLEALAYAIRSDWCKKGIKRRHIVVAWSDAPTHELGHAKEAPWYPKEMAKNFDELSLWWEDEQLGGRMDGNAKRLLMFAPDAPGWNRISDEWAQVIHVQTVSEGLLDVEYKQVLDAVCNTI